MACFNCGLCTAICDLTRGREGFPRKTIRYAQLGLRKRLDESIEPWLCYYCVDCNEKCPREARPSDQMMAFRRYLTSVYDWTGLLGRFYTSKRWAFGATAAIALSVIMLFVVLHLVNPGYIPTALAVAPDGTTHVPLNTFAPVEWVHLVDWILVGTLLFLIVTTLYNMRRKMLGGDRTLSIPFWLYITQLWVAPIHFLT
jgi:quinone-modifying oxidoreductase subunit QmoC